MAQPNWANRTLFHRDNLDILRSMNSCTVDLIATDPPFNKNKDFHATPDSISKGASFQDRWSWDKDVHEEWVDKITDDFPDVMNVIQGSRSSYGDDMGAFLCFMGVRLLEMHRILKPTGSIYLHCDPTASHYLKELMDSIFGRDNFRNEIVWKRATAKKGSTKKFGAVHDIILYYTKGPNTVFNTVYLKHNPDYVARAYRHKDSRGVFRVGDLTAAGGTLGTSSKSWRGVKVPSGKHWAVPTNWPKDIPQPSDWANLTTQSKLDYMDSVGLIYWPPRGKIPCFKRYLSTSKGAAMTDLITDISQLEGSDKEKVGYPTQKPLILYERLIKASSNECDIVLDPFCGCATTCVAAEKLNRQWVGIDIWDKAHKVVIERLKKEGYLADTGTERADLIYTKGMITYSKKPLKRTDGGSEAVPFLEIKMKEFDDRIQDPYSNTKKKELLLERDGPVCQGCGIGLHARYLELDHKLPRVDGGSNLLRNRILLCGPCNKLKRHLYTISWLRKENKKLGYMIDENALVSLK